MRHAELTLPAPRSPRHQRLQAKAEQQGAAVARLALEAGQHQLDRLSCGIRTALLLQRERERW